ncbi:MAG TPA: pectin acetylesterase-family hydrolase [Kofleriaceae bacterium]|nr:pectin acetylesterase-family hydrolase [Kofleriaceae bacterium]
MRMWGTVLVLATVACGTNDANEILNPARDAYGTWEKVEFPGTVCGNNTPFKMFVNYSKDSDNLAVVFEPGGACWDYDSCTGKNGIRGAANVNGIPDDHWQMAPFISPFLNRDYADSPTTKWNYVYVPYCTGDVHTGNTVATYSDGSGDSIEFHHEGHNDTEAVVQWIDQSFTHVPKMLVTGCSAGGVGSLVNYHFLRKGVHAAEKAYLLDDSGPIFPSSGYSGMMHAKIRSAWNLDSLAGDLPPGATLDDMGTINTALADEFPHDRLATTFFQRDYDFSLYSYERFYNFPPKDQIMSMWASDTDLLVDLYKTKKNLYYFLPYYRNVNDSHCTTVLSFAGSDIEDHNMTLAQWVSDFVNDKPVVSMREAPVSGEDGTP